jgi:hypothetical protein
MEQSRKNVPCELLANGTTMTRAELMRHTLTRRHSAEWHDLAGEKLKLD